jgi:hypothetical protein
MQYKALLAGALALTVGGHASAQPSSRCSREVLPVRGTPVTAGYCVADVGTGANHELPVRVTESYSSPHGAFAQEATLRFIAGESSSRVIEDVDLARLGLTGTLHLTLVFHGGLVRVESALLTPGAVTVK